MKLIFLLMVFVQASVVLAASHTIEMKSIEFSPRVLTIQAGDQIVWKNVALTDHTATSDDKENKWTTGMVKPGKSSKAIDFKKTGKYNYYCEVHGKKTMSATVVVQPKSKGK